MRGSARESREKEVVCLVARIQDFDSVVAPTSLRDLGSLMNRFYGRVADVVMASGGDVNRFCGSTVVAYYGVFRAIQENAIVDAGNAILRPLAESVESEFGVRVGVGTCRSTMLYGRFGSSERCTIVAFGPAEVCAARLAERLPGFTICERLGTRISSAPASGESISTEPHMLAST